MPNRKSADDRSNMNATYRPTATFSSAPKKLEFKTLNELGPTKKPTLKDQLKPLNESKPKATLTAKPKATPTPKRPMVGNDKEFNKKYGNKSWNNGYTN
jgi:hypothetical protein